MKAQIKGLSIGLDGKQILTVSLVGDFRSEYDRLKDKDISIDIKQFREKRSLDANAYCWVLITKFADVIRTDKDSMYFNMLKKYGQGGIVKIRDKDIILLNEFRYYEEHEKLYEEEAKYYRVWVGTSNYDTSEMSIFIDGVVSECKDLGIETATPEELARLKYEWGR